MTERLSTTEFIKSMGLDAHDFDEVHECINRLRDRIGELEQERHSAHFGKGSFTLRSRCIDAEKRIKELEAERLSHLDIKTRAIQEKDAEILRMQMTTNMLRQQGVDARLKIEQQAKQIVGLGIDVERTNIDCNESIKTMATELDRQKKYSQSLIEMNGRINDKIRGLEGQVGEQAKTITDRDTLVKHLQARIAELDATLKMMTDVESGDINGLQQRIAELERQHQYDVDQHRMICELLGVSPSPDKPGDTAFEAVNRLEQQLVWYRTKIEQWQQWFDGRLKALGAEQMIDDLHENCKHGFTSDTKNDPDFAWCHKQEPGDCKPPEIKLKDDAYVSVIARTKMITYWEDRRQTGDWLFHSFAWPSPDNDRFRYHVGTIREFATWDRILSNDEINRLAQWDGRLETRPILGGGIWQLCENGPFQKDVTTTREEFDKSKPVINSDVVISYGFDAYESVYPLTELVTYFYKPKPGDKWYFCWSKVVGNQKQFCYRRGTVRDIAMWGRLLKIEELKQLEDWDGEYGNRPMFEGLLRWTLRKDEPFKPEIKLTDVRYYDRTLTPGEVKESMENPEPREFPIADSVQYITYFWRFDKGSNWKFSRVTRPFCQFRNNKVFRWIHGDLTQLCMWDRTLSEKDIERVKECGHKMIMPSEVSGLHTWLAMTPFDEPEGMPVVDKCPNCGSILYTIQGKAEPDFDIITYACGSWRYEVEVGVHRSEQCIAMSQGKAPPVYSETPQSIKDTIRHMWNMEPKDGVIKDEVSGTHVDTKKWVDDGSSHIKPEPSNSEPMNGMDFEVRPTKRIDAPSFVAVDKSNLPTNKKPKSGSSTFCAADKGYFLTPGTFDFGKDDFTVACWFTPQRKDPPVVDLAEGWTQCDAIQIIDRDWQYVPWEDTSKRPLGMSQEWPYAVKPEHITIDSVSLKDEWGNDMLTMDGMWKHCDCLQKEFQERLEARGQAMNASTDRWSKQCEALIKQRDEAQAEAEKWKGLHEQITEHYEKALECVDQVFQAELPILRNYARGGENLFKAVVRLARDYKQLGEDYDYALKSVHKVFQSGAQPEPPILPKFERAFENHFDAVVRLANDYVRIEAERRQLLERKSIMIHLLMDIRREYEKAPYSCCDLRACIGNAMYQRIKEATG